MSLNHSEVLAHIALVLDLLEQIIIEQRQDASEILHIKKLITEGRGPHFSIDDQGVVKFKNRLVVPSSDELRRKILDEKERVTRNKVLKFYKVQWQNHSDDEATWEQESYILEHYPHLLPGVSR